jgi:hypothetical protein
MSEKLFGTEVAEIKALEQQANKLTLDRDEKVAVAEQLNAEVFALRERRDALEQIMSNASTLLLNNQLSKEDYAEGKKELSALYKQIDSTDEIFNIYDRAVNEDYVKQFSELQSKINSMRINLLNKFSKKLAQDIVNECRLPIMQLLAIFPDKSMTMGDSWKSLELGNSLVFALSHDIDGNIKRVEQDEPKLLINSIFKSLELEQ